MIGEVKRCKITLLTIRRFPEKSCSRKFPGIISGSREFSGIFYVLRRGNVLNFTIFQMFFFWFRSSFTVEKNTIHAENHWNSSMNCIFLRIGVFLSFYKVSFKVPGNSREFPDWFREIPVPGNENLSGNRPPYFECKQSFIIFETYGLVPKPFLLGLTRPELGLVHPPPPTL